MYEACDLYQAWTVDLNVDECCCVSEDLPAWRGLDVNADLNVNRCSEPTNHILGIEKF